MEEEQEETLSLYRIGKEELKFHKHKNKKKTRSSWIFTNKFPNLDGIYNVCTQIRLIRPNLSPFVQKNSPIFAFWFRCDPAPLTNFSQSRISHCRFLIPCSLTKFSLIFHICFNTDFGYRPSLLHVLVCSPL